MTSKKKITIISLSFIILVAVVVGLAITLTRHHGHTDSPKSNNAPASSSIKALCQPTDYKETCEKSLSSATNITDPKELITVAFNVAIKEISDVMNKSTLLQHASEDPRTVQAYQTCHKLLDDCIYDLKRSLDHLDKFDADKSENVVADVRTWLSGAITFQRTCLDGFENTTGDNGENMTQLLNTSQELTRNSLVMVSNLKTLLTTLQISGLSRRRLLYGEYPSWVDGGKRRLLQATPGTINADVVVAKDGSGKYKTISEALEDVPRKSNRTFVIYIKAGVYQEHVYIKSNMWNVMFTGDGKTKTKITGNWSNKGGVNTYDSATVAVEGDQFLAKDIGFENTAGATMHQAVALRVSSDRTIFYNCQMDGYQDTLYAHAYRQYYRDCSISGTVDFIFGDARAVFQNCKLIIREPLEKQSCMVTAQGRDYEPAPTGFVLQNCHITADNKYFLAKTPVNSYFGRPWKAYSRTIIMHSKVDGVIDPQGWAPWQAGGPFDTCWFAEFGNNGAGANQSGRARGQGIKKISVQEAASFTPSKFIEGDTWIPLAGVSYVPGIMDTLKV